MKPNTLYQKPVDNLTYPENRICPHCDFIIPMEWLICENCGWIQSKMTYQEAKYNKKWYINHKRLSPTIKDKKKKTGV